MAERTTLFGTIKNSIRNNFITQLNKTVQRNKQLRASYRPLITMLDVPNAETGMSRRVGYSSSNIAIDFTTGTGSILDRIMRYKEYDLMASIDTMCGNALDCYADNATIPDIKDDHVMLVETNDDELKEKVEDFLYGVLNIDHNARRWIWKLCKMGDHIVVLDIDMTGRGIVNFIEPRIQEIDRRDEPDPNTKETVTKYYWKMGGIGTTTSSGMHPVFGSSQYDTQNTQPIDPVEILHFSLDEDIDYAPFGKSKLEAARYAWKQLRLMEDAMLVYRIVRAPERRVFKIEVGNLQDEQMKKFVDDTLTEVRREAVVDPQTGDINLQYNVANTLEDFVFPQRGGFGSSIDVLPGGQNTDAIQDVEYMKSKVRAGLKVPRAFLEYDENLATARGLAKEDTRFAAAISTIQRIFKNQIYKACALHLLSLGVENGWTVERVQSFKLRMTNPSSEEELERLEKLERQANLFNQLVGQPTAPGAFSREFALRYVFPNLTDQELAINETGFLKDRRDDFIYAKITEAGNFNKIFPDFPAEEAAPEQKGHEMGGGPGGFSGGFGGGGGFSGPIGGGPEGSLEFEEEPIAGEEAFGPEETPEGGAPAPNELTVGTPAAGLEENPQPGIQTAGYSSAFRRMKKFGRLINDATTTDGLIANSRQRVNNIKQDLSKVLPKLNAETIKISPKNRQ